MTDPRPPYVDRSTSRYAELYRRAAERARFEHPEMVPGHHSPGEWELRGYVGRVIRERGTYARMGPELLVAVYLRGLDVSPERWALVWGKAMSVVVMRQQQAYAAALAFKAWLDALWAGDPEPPDDAQPAEPDSPDPDTGPTDLAALAPLPPRLAGIPAQRAQQAEADPE